PRPRVPLVTCKPWCVHGDGHPGEWNRNDQWCGTRDRTVPQSAHPDEEWSDGVTRPAALAVTGTQVPDEDPAVCLSGHRCEIMLTAPEAVELATVLLATVLEMTGGPALPDDDGTELDAELGLSVFVDHGAVVQSGRPGEDGEWHHTPESARALATALLHHADRAEARR
ncbi:hypothetical protein, partial [Actinotalea ferrariae]|uniref:hypothetical protein n=1 Tax=Actinotalea ferrariae TaxID=1386098 RepID=UPI00054F88FC